MATITEHGGFCRQKPKKLKAENLATDVPFYVLLFISTNFHNQRSDKVDVKASSKETQEWPEQKRAVCQIAIFINFHQNVNGMD